MPYHKWRMCPDCNEMHDVYAWPGNHRLPSEAVCAPSVISDSLPDLKHPQSDRIHDSKSNFRKDTKSWGGIEVGTEPIKDRRWVDKPKADDVALAKQMVDQGYKPRIGTATKEEMSSIVKAA